MTMKMTLKKKNTSHKYDINRPRPRHRSEYTKCKMCLNIMMVVCIKQHLNKEIVAYKKSVYVAYKKSV